MKLIINIIKKFIDILLTLIIIFGIVFVFLYLFKIEPYVVLSGSMEPKLHTGSLSFINKNIKYEDIKEQDIVAYKTSSGALVSHRVIKIEKDGFITQGDANKVDDGLSVTKLNYIGKTVFNIPYVGYVVKFIQTKIGKIISVCVIVLMIGLSFIFGDDKEKKKQKES